MHGIVGVYFGDGIEDGKAQVVLAPLSRSNAANHVCAILNRLSGMKCALQIGMVEGASRSTCFPVRP